MSENSCATREELINLDDKMSMRLNRVEDKISDICKGQGRISEHVIKLGATTDALKVSIEQLSSRQAEQKDAIIKDITLLALQNEGTKLFKDKCQTIIGGGSLWILGMMAAGMIGFLSQGTITKILQALS